MDQALADDGVRMNTLKSQGSQVLAGNEEMMFISGVTIPDTVKASVDEYLARGASILVALSKKMMNTIKINLTFSLLLNGVAIILAMVGSLSPVWGALVHNGGSLLVVANSALLLTWAYKK